MIAVVGIATVAMALSIKIFGADCAKDRLSNHAVFATELKKCALLNKCAQLSVCPSFTRRVCTRATGTLPRVKFLSGPSQADPFHDGPHSTPLFIRTRHTLDEAMHSTRPTYCVDDVTYLEWSKSADNV